MDEIKITVDEILEEIQFNKRRDEMLAPTNDDIKKVNELVEQLLTEKKAAKVNINSMSKEERDAFNREIKAQTRSITRQFEKIVKRQQREEKAIEREIHPDEEDRRAYEQIVKAATQNTQSLRLAKLKSEQKVKLQNTQQLEAAIEKNEHRQEKLDLLKASAHTEHIRREMVNITSHFGNFKMTDNSADEGFAKAQMNAAVYKEYRKSRSKKIDSFSLNDSQDTGSIVRKNAHSKEEIAQEDMSLTSDGIAVKPEPEKSIDIEHEQQGELLVKEEKPQTNAENQQESTEQENETVVNADEQALEEYGELIMYEDEYANENEKQEVLESLERKQKSAKLNVAAMSVLSVVAVLLSLVFVSDGILQFANIIEISPIAFVSCNVILLLLSMIFSRSIFFNALDSISNRMPSKDVLFSITTIICFASNMLLLFSHKSILTPEVFIYSPIVTISLLFNAISKNIAVSQALRNFEYIASPEGDNKHGVAMVRNYRVASDMTKGVVEDEPLLVKNVKTSFFKNFLTHSFQNDRSDEICYKVALSVLPIGLALAMLAYLFYKDVYVSVTVISGIMAMATTFIGPILVMFPLHDTSDITRHFGDMAPCVDAIEKFSAANSILIDAHDLFPAEAVKLQGIKTFSGKRIDDAIVDAASIVTQSNSILSNVFMDIIANNTELLKKVDTIIYEDLMGISAWVDDKRVLIGNRELMVNHSIAVPKKEYEESHTKLGHDVVYLAAEGELAAAFIIQISTNREIFDVVNLLERNEMRAIIKSVDSILTVDKIAELFNIEPSFIKILPSRLHSVYEKEIEQTEQIEISLGNNGTLLGYLIGAVAAKKLSYCVRAGAVINILGIILGVIMFTVLMLAGNLSAMSSLIMLGYMGLFTAVYWIFQKNIHL